MPIYEYQCDGCGDVFEVRQRISDPAPAQHACGSNAIRRVLSATSFVLKGTGWYATDYGNRSAPPKEGGGDRADGGGADGKADGKPDAKPDGKAEASSKTKDGKGEAAGASGDKASSAKPRAGEHSPAKPSASNAAPKPKGGGSPAAA